MSRFLPVVVLLAACGSATGLKERPVNATCAAPARPPAGGDIELVEVFTDADLSVPIALQQRDDDDAWFYVAQKDGHVVRMQATGAESEVIDVSGRLMNAGQETGLLGLAFHPDFANHPQLFLSYTGSVDGDLTSIIARYSSTDGGATFDEDSEEVLLEITQPFTNHNGGNILFGPDGYLYAGFGDGGSGGDPLGSGQDTSVLLGKMLRIDVDSGSPYGIPADNPFADGAGGRPEIYAWGLRNPWRWSFDKVTGELWVGDVGQDRFEEVDLVERGGNYGWNTMEGFHCFSPQNGCDESGLIKPIVEYTHEEGSSIAGGYVYRGTTIPGLVGKFVYADSYSATIWAVDHDEDGAAYGRELLTNTGLTVVTFGEGNDGELYAPNYANGRIYKLAPAGEPVADTFPQLLSETGCVDPSDPTTPAEGLIPYEPQVALWSDGADKLRWLAIPDDSVIAWEGDALVFPVGTVMMKEFSVGEERVETRLMIRHEDGGWAGYTYRWNDAGTDADLLPSSDSQEVGGQTWHYPARSDCLTCHTELGGRTLGPTFRQLNHELDYGKRTANQLATWDYIGLVEPKLGDVESFPAYPAIDDESAPVEDRAMAYLATNCAMCHQPDGTGGGDLDLRDGIALAERGLCDAEPSGGDLGVAGAKIVTPGDPAASILSIRMHSTDANAMPPLAKTLVDEDGTALIDAWISSLGSCP